MRKEKKPRHYIDNKTLYTELVKYITAVEAAKVNEEPKPRIPETVGKAIMMIATNLSTKPNFLNYSYREEMISDGIENCIMYLHNFNPDKSTNAFAYITQIIYFAFLRRIEKERKQQYTRHKLLMNSSIMNSIGELPQDDAVHFNNVLSYMDGDKSRDLIEKFEKTTKAKKAQKSSRGVEKFMEKE